MRARRMAAPSAAASTSALASFLVCAMLGLVLYLYLHFAAVGFAETNSAAVARALSEPEEEVRAWLIEEKRWRARESATFLLIILAVYWVLAAIFGKGGVGRSPSANGLLILGLCAHLGVALNSYYGWAETNCDQLPYPHEGFQLAKISECPSSSMFFATLFGASLVLILGSLAVRIVMSRKEAAKGN